jgi:tRNA 2-thiouridine synthesizing protein A
MEGIIITREVDARGSQCPGPLMELIRMVKTAAVGDVLAVVSTEAGTGRDLPAWATKAGHTYLGSEPALGAVRYLLRKAR